MTSLDAAQKAMILRGSIVEEVIRLRKPELLDLFLTYQNEAVAARKFLDNSLSKLTSGDKVLEVGGGILALAVQLASEGYLVTTVEPVGEGFGSIAFMMNIFSEVAIEEKIEFDLIKLPIEECEFVEKFRFIFSINVMEHLKDPYSAIIQLVENLDVDGNYRFFCPNYDFPYEPHFAKWMFRRRNNAFFLPQSRSATGKLHVEETSGLYSSLNFLTFKKLKKATIGIGWIRLKPNKLAFFDLLRRALNDPGLKNRHKRLSIIVKVINLSGILRLSKVFPYTYQPVMDIEITKV